MSETVTDPMDRMTAAGAVLSTMCPGCGENRTVNADGTFEPHHTAHNGVDGPLCDQGTESESQGETLPAVVEDEVRALERQLATMPDVPITPEMSELTRMAQLAVTFSAAKLVPKDLQGSPADVLLIMMTARSLGLDYPTGFRELFVIDGKVSMSTKQKLALVRQRGYNVWPDPTNDDQSATWYGIRDGIRYSSTFDMGDANRVEAREHQKTITLDEKSTYKQFPKRMLSWRACGYLLDDAYSDVATGIYSPDELGAVTDEDGRVIDISEVQPLVRSEKDERRAEQQAAKAELAPEEERIELKARVDALPASFKGPDGELSQRWREADFPPAMEMPKGSLRRAKSMVKGFEAKARAGGWEPKAAEAPESPESDSGSDAPSEAPEAQEAPEEPPITDDSEDTDAATSEPEDSDAQWPAFPEDHDEQGRFVSRLLAGMVGNVDPAALGTMAEEVKGMSWQAVDRALADDYGMPKSVIDRLHIDSRRMYLTGYRLAERPM